MNCFQFCIFAVWNTTLFIDDKESIKLWIAFNFVSLQCETQLFCILLACCSGCELLSILYLCNVKHNLFPHLSTHRHVVNCFQFCIFAVWNTTLNLFSAIFNELWIAFNFVSLQCETQLVPLVAPNNLCCELLSILYLCSVKHNHRDIINIPVIVVNCFQFCIFAVWNTTVCFACEINWKLWIAFNFVSLQCETQLRSGNSNFN